jgi:beta-lactamase superfamily II metal-dependent hydrolase
VSERKEARMHEIDFLPVGDGARSGDAIAMRFTRPDTGKLAHVLIDGGFADTGAALVDHVRRYYETDTVDAVVLTHPDGDHIGGLGIVLGELDVGVLLAHDLAAHGGAALPAAEATTELIALAQSEGTDVYEPFAGVNAFGGALLVVGPSQSFYEERVAEEVSEQTSGTRAVAAKSTLREMAQQLSARILSAFPFETDFGDSGGTNPRNNSSAIIDIGLPDHRFLFTADAGVPAVDAALDFLESEGRTSVPLKFVQVPHHGSRHNGSRALVERMLGSPTDERRGGAFISISEAAAGDPRYPSPRIVNAFGRRSYRVGVTAGQSIYHHSADAPDRGWGPIDHLPPLDESIDDRP